MGKIAWLIVLAVMVLGPAKSGAAATWGASTTITSYYFYASGSWLYLKLGTTQNPEGCSQATRGVLLSFSHTRFKETYATILAAQSSGSQISVLYDGCDVSSGFPIITGIASPSAF